MKRILLILNTLIWLLILFDSCNDEPEVPSLLEKGEEFPGGEATVFDLSVNAFGNPAPNLKDDRDLLFITGNSFFNRNWVTAPSSTVNLDGLGPLFISRSCSGCHFKDGRGQPPLTPEESPVALLFRLSIPGNDAHGAPKPEPVYGGQLSTRAVLGVDEEGTVSVTYQEVSGQFADGESYSLRKPVYTFKDLKYGQMDPTVQVSPRIAQHMVGLGLLEAIDEETLKSFADPDDLNNDEISGKLNMVWDEENQTEAIGRFGWKANQPSLRQQVAGAFLGDIGITSSIFPNESCTSPQNDCNDATQGGTPELEESLLEKVTLYSSSLAVPKRRDWDDAEVLEGKKLFLDANCDACHIPKITTGIYDPIPEFSNQPIRPFTDLLLHDMGEGLTDGRPDFLANGNEWRTPPLWGIGMIEIVNGHTNLMHDGRARNIEEAILWHGGEAESSQQYYISLPKSDRNKLLKYLNSL